jgi:hypothetical protein
MLQIFRSHKVAAGQMLMTSDLYITLFSMVWRASYYAAAIKHAESRDWLIDEGSVVRLRRAGFFVANLADNMELMEAPSPGEAST